MYWFNVQTHVTHRERSSSTLLSFRIWVCLPLHFVLTSWSAHTSSTVISTCHLSETEHDIAEIFIGESWVNWAIFYIQHHSVRECSIIIVLFLTKISTYSVPVKHLESCSNQKKCFVFEILQSSHSFPWWQLCTLLAFSQPVSWRSHLECISINRCALFKVNLWNFFPS